MEKGKKNNSTSEVASIEGGLMRRIYIICLSIILITLAVLFDCEASTVSINILSPEESEVISGHISISAKIEKNGRPFLERGGFKWVSAVIRDSRGIDSIRISLRDNGKGGDRKADDGIWTSLAKARLAEGVYALSIVVREENQTFLSRKITFNVKPETAIEQAVAKETRLLNQTNEIVSKLNMALKNLDAQLLKEDNNVNVLNETRKIASKLTSNLQKLNQLVVINEYLRKDISDKAVEMRAYLKWMLYTGAVVLVLLTGLILFALFKTHKSREPALAQSATDSVKQSKEIAPTEKWRPVFSELERMRKGVAEMEKDLSGTYHVHSRYKGNFERIVSNIISLYESVKGLKEIPKEHMNAFRLTLAEAFETVDVEKWEPEIGKPVPEGCEQEPATQDYPYPEGTVVEVLSPGYRIREHEQFIPVKKPTVVVVGSKKL